ncbi:MAG TPA: endonuclease/exonuclease/phosphatase family protein [Actinomycetota bacterium]|nr:endonuclease/exonuclease/phosphatase family protein [Actinomycetota bacterium]
MSFVTVATFNIRHGEGRDGKVDLDRTAAAIKATGASFIALQEVDRGMKRTGGVDQPAELARLTGLHISFHPTLQRGDGRYGLAIASTIPVDSVFKPLPRASADEEPRGFVTAQWKGFMILATHLSRARAGRKLQTSAIELWASTLARARYRPGRRPIAPAVVLGDFNQGPRDLNGLLAAGFTRTERPPVTLKAGRGRAIDHVLAGPGSELGQVWTIETDASDHLPLVAELRVTSAPSH